MMDRTCVTTLSTAQTQSCWFSERSSWPSCDSATSHTGRVQRWPWWYQRCDVFSSVMQMSYFLILLNAFSLHVDLCSEMLLCSAAPGSYVFMNYACSLHGHTYSKYLGYVQLLNERLSVAVLQSPQPVWFTGELCVCDRSRLCFTTMGTHC